MRRISTPTQTLRPFFVVWLVEKKKERGIIKVCYNVALAARIIVWKVVGEGANSKFLDVFVVFAVLELQYE